METRCIPGYAGSIISDENVMPKVSLTSLRLLSAPDFSTLSSISFFKSLLVETSAPRATSQLDYLDCSTSPRTTIRFLGLAARMRVANAHRVAVIYHTKAWPVARMTWSRCG
jgi:hypothetical protein